jgi:hypothetical protein
MDSLETSPGSSFAGFETKLVSQDTQGTGPSKNVNRSTTLDVEHTVPALIKISGKFFVIFREGIGCKVNFD